MSKKKISILISSIILIATIIAVCHFENQQIIYEEAKKNEMENEIELAEQSIENNTDKEELQDGILGVLEIKKINMKGLVKEGSDSEVLKNYVGHIENTPKYDGNICLAAHNRGNLYSYFAKLNQLNIGDEIKYKTIFEENYFTIDRIEEIDESDWSMLQDTDEDKITLITCIKNKKEKRLCVQASKKFDL